MFAYGVFAGGGFKGAALCGALKSAEERGIVFKGLGGTSAGAIVAALAAVGYSADEMYSLLEGQLLPQSFFPDKGRSLARVFTFREDLLEVWSNTKKFLGKPRAALSLNAFVKKNKDLLEDLFQHSGIYESKVLGEKLFDVLVDGPKLKGSKNALLAKGDVTFADLQQAKCPPLKIVASNISGRRSAVFSADSSSSLCQSVLEAVKASASYPFVFRPLKRPQGETRLADGGLSSNLPTFLFASEQCATRYPTIAFDLVEHDVKHSTYGILQFAGDVLGTALSASDDLLFDANPDALKVRIKVPRGITTFKLDLTNTDLTDLFEAGRDNAKLALHKYDRIISRSQRASSAAKPKKAELQARYGEPELFTLLLYSVAKLIEERTHAERVRSQIMLPTGVEGSLGVVYTYGFTEEDKDSDLELVNFGGCSGKAFTEAKPAVADLVDAKTSFSEWGMTKMQQDLVREDRKAMLSVPIFAADAGSKQYGISEAPRIGILSVDSSTSLAGTDWICQIPGSNDIIRAEVSAIMESWARICSKQLQAGYHGGYRYG
jgi:NTE family protein